MYHSAAEVWSGLTKNATEGMAKKVSLIVWTLLLFGGQVLPFVLLAAVPTTPAMVAVVLVIGLRLLLAARFRQSEISAVLHPVGILVLLALQWSALIRAIRGAPSSWRGRTYPAQ